MQKNESIKRRTRVAVIGAGQCVPGSPTYDMAFELGGLLAESGYDVVCGGLAGVMESVCKGARKRGGKTIGIVPGYSIHDANQWVETPIATGLGQMRNALVVLNGDIVVAVGGGYGTLSETALAKKSGKTVIAIGEMGEVDGVMAVDSPAQAVAIVDKELRRG